MLTFLNSYCFYDLSRLFKIKEVTSGWTRERTGELSCVSVLGGMQIDR
jgi:hypothetical protein